MCIVGFQWNDKASVSDIILVAVLCTLFHRWTTVILAMDNRRIRGWWGFPHHGTPGIHRLAQGRNGLWWTCSESAESRWDMPFGFYGSIISKDLETIASAWSELTFSIGLALLCRLGTRLEYRYYYNHNAEWYNQAIVIIDMLQNDPPHAPKPDDVKRGYDRIWRDILWSIIRIRRNIW